MRVFVEKAAPTEPVSNLGGGNTIDAHGVERYQGWSAVEALSAACSVGTLYAWEWLQAWNNAELEDDDKGPGGEAP